MKNIPSEFLWRRLHSLTGIVPLGAFLFEHFFTNSFSHAGAAHYNEKVEFLRSLPYVIFLEYGMIFLPFLFHAFFGLIIITRGQANVGTYNYTRNWLYFFMRLSSFFVLAFVLFHVLTLRYGWWDGQFGHPNHVYPDFYDLMSRLFNDPLMVVVYVVGVVATTFHFANGLNTFCMTWGIAIGRQAQRFVGYACIGLFFLLTGMAIWSMVGFRGEGTVAELKAQGVVPVRIDTPESVPGQVPMANPDNPLTH